MRTFFPNGKIALSTLIIGKQCVKSVDKCATYHMPSFVRTGIVLTLAYCQADQTELVFGTSGFARSDDTISVLLPVVIESVLHEWRTDLRHLEPEKVIKPSSPVWLAILFWSTMRVDQSLELLDEIPRASRRVKSVDVFTGIRLIRGLEVVITPTSTY